MSRPVTLRPLARVEYDAAGNWYEQQQPGLGDRFTDAVQKVFDEIAANPLRHAEACPGIREAQVPGFKSYCVYYRVRQDV